MENRDSKKTGPDHGGRPRMPVSQRAKQFAPFAAVTGLGAAIAKKDREFESIDTVELEEEEELP